MRQRSAVLQALRGSPRDASGLPTWVRVAGVAAILPALCVSAFAHGGSYRGPKGEVPPDSREPSDPPPPGGGDPPGTPGGNDPGGPTTDGGGGVGPGTGGTGTGGGPTDGGGTGGPPPVGGGGGIGTGGTGRRTRGGGAGFDDWQYWWNHNKAEILGLRGAVDARRGPLTGSAAHALGHGGVGSKVQTATKAAIHSVVVPLLREVLADVHEHFDVRSAAAIALAKISDPLSVDPVRELSRNGDGKAHKVVVESSALALGLYERDDATVRDSLLEAVADDSRSGSFARPFSAIALGFQPARGDAAAAVQSALLTVVAGRENGEDVKAACLVALGMRGDASAIPALLRIVATGRAPGEGAVPLDDVDRSHAVQALGRIGLAGSAAGDTAVVDALLGRLGKGADDSPHIVRSAIVALGRVAPAAPPQLLGRCVAVLSEIAGDSNPADSQSRHFALIALGRIGADARTSDAVRRDCVSALGRVLDKGRPSQLVQPFAAMGLGLVARYCVTAERPVDEESIRKPLREKFAETKDISSRSAFALASGLAGDPRASDLLLPVLEDRGENKGLRGYAALALGLIRDPRAVEPVRSAVLESSDRELSLQAAIAAGLLGDPRAVDDLVAVLRDTERSQYVLGSVAVALGAIGDERAIAPLCAIVRDAKAYPELTRALAVVALGRIGDPREVPTLARLATDFNYRAYVPATRELLTIL